MIKNDKQSIERRLRIIEGHLKKVRKMVQEDAYCVDILHQARAVHRALTQVEAMLLDKHLHSCVIRDIKNGDKKAVDELSELFKKINK